MGQVKSVCVGYELTNFERLPNPPALKAEECFETVRALGCRKIRECVAGSSSFWEAQDMAMSSAIKCLDRHLWHFYHPLGFNYDTKKYHLPVS